ncbi:MAG: sugar nucleotide-binding protein [Candidatus Limiplasma sp.]|nr:sugar nucleotide-binding protein [Candidatus Limiplasma sp.]
MKILVLGACGMAGHMISTYFAERGNDVTGFDRIKGTHCSCNVAGDARDIDSVAELIRQGDFDAVINCIGILNQFAEYDKALASFLNAYFPHFLAEVTKPLNAQVVHMSTDCVFSGKRGCYTENDFRDGESFYDRSKALGELEDEKNITLRNSIIGPDLNPDGIGLLNWFMQQTGEINGFTKAIWTGQTTLQLAKTMEVAIQEHACGLYNTVPDVSITKYDLLKLCNYYMRNDALTIHTCHTLVADKSLKRTRFDFSYRVPDYETMVRELSDWMRQHATLYPHYILG